MQLKIPKLATPKMPALAWPLHRPVGDGITALNLDGGFLRVTATKGRQVAFWQQIPLPPDALRHGWIADADSFGKALRALLDESALPRARVLWALPGSIAIGRVLGLDLGGATDPRALVAREAARVMPVNPEDHYLYWQDLADGHVFTLAVRKEAIDSLMQACRQAKIRPWTIDLKPLALMLAIGQEDAIIADAEVTSADVIIVSKGVPVVMRSLWLGGAAFDGAYARTKLIDELTIALQLFNETNQDSPLEQATPVYLTGDLADEELAGKIAFVTKHPTVEPHPPIPCPPGFPLGRYMVNLGLLMKR